MCARQITIDELQLTLIDPDSPVPLYYQIEADLRALLNSPQVSPGDLMPTENELAEVYGVGRHTIRTALGRLVNDNLISRKAGHGTVVKGREDRRQFSLARSFTRQMAAMGLQSRSVVLNSEIRSVQSSDPHSLSSRKLDAPILVLERLRFGNEEPIGLQRSFVALEHCPGIEASDFASNSLYEVLSHQYHLVITEITHTVGATTADTNQAELLSVEPGAPLLVVTTAAFLENGEIIEVCVSHYRADKYEYTITHRHRDDARKT